MSATTNVQNLLVNVFRPLYEYDTTGNFYKVKLDLCNVDGIFTNTVTTLDLAVGDSAGNVYVGSNAGNSFTDIRGCSNTTALGNFAGNFGSNVRDSVYLGYRAGLAPIGANAVISLGAYAGGGGSSNIFIGNYTGANGGSNNIMLGHNLSPPVGTNDTLYIGHDLSSVILTGDLSNNWIGINTTEKYTPLDTLDVSGYTYIRGALGINASPLTNTLNVNGDFKVQDGFGIMTFDRSLVTSNTEVDIRSYTPGKTSILNVVGTVVGSEGVVSSQGEASDISAGGVRTIGVLRDGMMMVAIRNSPFTGSYDSRVDFVLDQAAGTVSNLSSNQSAAFLQYTGSNINISNSTGSTLNFRYVITYFPLP
jgi:hypothetical protein